jgi:glycosyltransferase involved in cell wall biosynthesis
MTRWTLYQWRMQSRLPLSVAVITLNEEANLERCLDSVRDLAAEIVVVDSGSTDRTAEIARSAGAVFVSHPWQGFTRQKNLSLERCTQSWVLCLDADEAVSPELASAIRRALEGKPAANGFWVNRRTFFLGEWIRHAWYPEWRLRLVRRDGARWAGTDPHPGLEATGNAEKLSGDLLHYSYANLREYFERTVRYARTSADNLERDGKSCHWYHLVVSPWLALGKRLILKQGFRDGCRGWIIAYATFFSVLAKYAFLFEKRPGAGHGKSSPLPPAQPESRRS